MRNKWVVCLLGLVLALSVMAKVSASGPTFTTIDFPGAVVSSGTDINDSGQIVGEYTFSDLGHRKGFLLSNGVFTSIDFPGAVITLGFGLNSSDDVVGGYRDTSGGVHGYLRTP